MIRSSLLHGSSLPLLAATAFLSSTAQAVQTKNCPPSIQAELRSVKLLANDDIRSFERHTRYSKEMFDEALASRDRVEKHLPETGPKEKLVLAKRESGRCTYRQENAMPDLRALRETLGKEPSSAIELMSGAKSRRVVLYTKGGRDLFREEFELPYQRRESETFVVETTLAAYSPEGIRLETGSPSALKVTVRYPCYDQRCLTEATIGEAVHGAL